MGAGRKTQTFNSSERAPWSPMSGNCSVPARNLRKSDLGGVIFGCKHCTMMECLSKQLFGLPSSHMSYVTNIEPGLPLFLFNYSDRKLHGVYEAASHGQMNIDPYAWTDGGTERTQFPAQVRIHTKLQCRPLTEKQFGEIIQDNYYTTQHFRFELDHAQTKGLTALFTPSPLAANIRIAPTASSKTKWTVLPASGQKESMSSFSIEHVNPEDRESNGGVKSCVDFGNVNKFASLGWDDGDDEHFSSSKTSSSAHEGSEAKETPSDWEDLEQDNLQFIPDGVRPLSDVENQTMLGHQSAKVGSESEVESVLKKLQKLSADRECLNPSSKACIDDNVVSFVPRDLHEDSEQFPEEPTVVDEEFAKTSDLCFENAELLQVVKELKERTSTLEKKQVESDEKMIQMGDLVKVSKGKIQRLVDRVNELESKLHRSMELVNSSQNEFVEQYLGSEKVIYLIGGYNGTSWLSALDSFLPLLDVLTPLKPMSSARSYASAAALDGNIYVFGGGDGSSWYNTVERYNRRDDDWTTCPQLNREKGSLAGATLNGKIFAIGGGDGFESFSDVEMFDPALGKWINNQSMLHKRFAPAAVELHGVLYTVGGYDGNNYLQSAERFDPREASWTRLPNMNTRRGCHSLAVLNEKMFALGGYDGEKMVSTVEIFDPRFGSWMMGDPMHFTRGYAAAATLDDSLFVIGGVKVGDNIVDTVERYREGTGWTITDLKAIGKRCFFSAIVL